MRFPELRDSKVPAIPLEVAQIFRESTIEDIDLVVKEDTGGALSGKVVLYLWQTPVMLTCYSA